MTEGGREWTMLLAPETGTAARQGRGAAAMAVVVRAAACLMKTVRILARFAYDLLTAPP